jgi:DNA-binding Xre family transcriptional regulator
MLRINLQRICKVRGVERPTLYLQSCGLTVTTATRAVKGEYENFSMETIERLCLIFHCTPNDLLEWTPPKSSNIPETEPLYALRRLDKVSSVSQLINNASLEQLEKMEQIIKTELGM